MLRYSLVLLGFLLGSTLQAHAERCIASIYGNDKYAWRKTASGIPMNPGTMIAAHKTLPFWTKVTVTNESNGKTTEVCIVDRGPYIAGRCIDLSPKAASALGFNGLAKVSLLVQVGVKCRP